MKAQQQDDTTKDYSKLNIGSILTSVGQIEKKTATASSKKPAVPPSMNHALLSLATTKAALANSKEAKVSVDGTTQKAVHPPCNVKNDVVLERLKGPAGGRRTSAATATATAPGGEEGDHENSGAGGKAFKGIGLLAGMGRMGNRKVEGFAFGGSAQDSMILIKPTPIKPFGMASNSSSSSNGDHPPHRRSVTATRATPVRSSSSRTSSDPAPEESDHHRKGRASRRPTVSTSNTPPHDNDNVEEDEVDVYGDADIDDVSDIYGDVDIDENEEADRKVSSRRQRSNSHDGSGGGGGGRRRGSPNSRRATMMSSNSSKSSRSEGGRHASARGQNRLSMSVGGGGSKHHHSSHHGSTGSEHTPSSSSRRVSDAHHHHHSNSRHSHSHHDNSNHHAQRKASMSHNNNTTKTPTARSKQPQSQSRSPNARRATTCVDIASKQSMAFCQNPGFLLDDSESEFAGEDEIHPRERLTVSGLKERLNWET